MINQSFFPNIGTKKLTIKDALNFLKTDDNQELESWRSSAQAISNSFYHNTITYTTNIFLPLTFLCRNFCTYCGFRRSSVPLGTEFLDPKKIEYLLIQAKKFNVSEILITMGEKPEEKLPKAKKWLKIHGFESGIEYIFTTAERALKYGLLPHINAGTLSLEEFSYLHEVSASMGLMLEIIGSRMTGKNMPHEYSPDKVPQKRITSLKNAGRLKIPFTSGLLIGIGETLSEVVSSLFVLRNLSKKYNHIQEVIIQNFQPNKMSKMAGYPPVTMNLMEKIVILARHVLPIEVSIQVPPNLVKNDMVRFIKSGISDWGGISSLTPDYINPSHRWPKIIQIDRKMKDCGYKMIERLPLYPRYINQKWTSQRIYDLILSEELANEDGYRK